MKNTPPVYILSQVLQVTLIDICKISHQIFYFLLVYVNFYIIRHNFSQIIRTSFIIIWKKDFCHKFFFFSRFTQTSAPPERPKSAKRDKCFLSILPYSIFFQNKSLHGRSYQMVQNFWDLQMNHLGIWKEFVNLLRYCYKKIW